MANKNPKEEHMGTKIEAGVLDDLRDVECLPIGLIRIIS
jgi:hypothetical protein